jgi:hypothetical protein
VVSSLHHLLQLLLATAFVACCSVVSASSASPALAFHDSTDCAHIADPGVDAECELDAALPTQEHSHAPDLLGLDDAPEDEDVSDTSSELTIYGPGQSELCHLDDRLAPKLAPHTQLERPPRV